MKILKILREQLNLTQNQISEKTNIDIETIRKYETNRYKPTVKNIATYSNFFGLSIDYLLSQNQSNYIRNLKLWDLSLLIDKNKKDQIITIEQTISALLNKHDIKMFTYSYDDFELTLTTSINQNLRILRKLRKLTQIELGNEFNISTRMISGYEKDTIPPLDKLHYLAMKLEVSIHCLITGKKLSFDFKNKEFGEIILKADHFLNFDEQKMLIQLMETFLNT